MQRSVEPAGVAGAVERRSEVPLAHQDGRLVHQKIPEDPAHPGPGPLPNPRGEFAAQDAYGLLDLFATYTPTDQLTLQLSVNNVLDKTYYRNLAGEWGSFFYSASGIYGEPRSFQVTARYKF